MLRRWCDACLRTCGQKRRCGDRPSQSVALFTVSGPADFARTRTQKVSADSGP